MSAITDTEIRALRRTAYLDGNLALDAICVFALGGTSALEGADPGTEYDLLLAKAKTQKWARAECAKACAKED